MKSITRSELPSDDSYPMLKRWSPCGIIVLFTGPTEGVVVANGSINSPLGTYRNDWSDHNASRYRGRVELYND